MPATVNAGDHAQEVTVGHVVDGVGKPADVRTADVAANDWVLRWISLEGRQEYAHGTEVLAPEPARAGLLPGEGFVEIASGRGLNE